MKNQKTSQRLLPLPGQLALVVSPLISLIDDQRSALRARPAAAAPLRVFKFNSTLTVQEKQEALGALAALAAGAGAGAGALYFFQ